MAKASIICGVDEAGRGPLAGPVYAAAVVLDSSRSIGGIADSKSLTAARRERVAFEIRSGAHSWAVARATVEEIDQLNILRATLLAMQRAVAALTIVPDKVMIDGLHCPELPYPVYAVVRGDVTVQAISAASILAKTARDAEMLLLHEQYPHYGFDRHKGYPTVAHLEALRRHGASAVHRRSFAPVRQLLGTF